jgi:hypothetical protein
MIPICWMPWEILPLPEKIERTKEAVKLYKSFGGGKIAVAMVQEKTKLLQALVAQQS